MATVTHKLLMPDSSVPASASIRIRLVASTDPTSPVEGTVTGTGSVVGALRPAIDGTGTWTANLVSNSLISPAGTVYEVIEGLPGLPPAKFYITVPGGGGRAETLLTTFPGALPGPSTLVGPVGPIGTPGVGFTPAGIYNSGTTYSATQSVYWAGRWWGSLVAGNVGHDPLATAGTYWGSLLGDVYAPVYNAHAYGALGDGSDATSGLIAAIAAAAADPGGQGGVVWLPYGAYPVTATLSVPAKVAIDGPPFGNGNNAAIYHRFNGHLFDFAADAAPQLSNLYLINDGAYTGHAVNWVLGTATAGFGRMSRVVITDFTTSRGWQRDLYIDGSAVTTGAVGARSLFFDDCQFFGAYTTAQTVYLKRVVHCYFRDCEIIQSPQTSVVCGLALVDALSEDVGWTGGSIDAQVYTEASQFAFFGRIRQGGAITCAAGSANNMFYGDVLRASFTNLGAGTNRVV